MKNSVEIGASKTERQGLWSKLGEVAAAMEYTSTDYLLDRMNRLENTVQDLRTEIEEIKRSAASA